jgi:hypothetical protein
MAAMLEVDGGTITRGRDKEGNWYTWQPVAGEVQKWKAIRLDIPTTIQQILNISELSFQGQHDGPFWLNASPAEVGRAVNAAVDLVQVGQGLTYVRRLESEAVAQVGAWETLLAESKAKLVAMQWWPACGAAWDEVEALLARRDQAQQVWTTTRAKVADVEAAVSQYRAAAQAADTASGLTIQHNATVAVRDRLAKAKADLDTVLRQVRLDTAATVAGEILRGWEEHRVNVRAWVTLRDAVGYAADKAKAATQAKQELVDLEKAVGPAVCAACGRPL